MKKKIIIAIGILCIGGAGTFAFYKTNMQKKEILPSAVYTVAETQKVVSNVEADGVVSFKDKENIYAKNNGKVEDILVEDGDSVNKGDLLIKYDTSPIDKLNKQLQDAKLNLKSANIALEGLLIPTEESQIKQLEAQITQSEKSILDIQNNLVQLDRDIQKAQRDLDAGNKLFIEGAISQTELNNYQTVLTNFRNQKTSAENSLDVAKKQLEANKSQLESAKNKQNDKSNQNRIASQKVMIEQAQLRIKQISDDINDFEKTSTSPIKGTVIKTYVSDGEAVTEGKLLLEIGDVNNLIIEAFIPEYDMESIAVSQKVRITSDATDEEFEGEITKIYPIAEVKGDKSVVKVEISMPKTDILKAGYTTKLNITTNVEEEAVVIPIISYMTEKVDNVDTEYVYIIKDDNTLEKRQIKVKAIQNSVASVEGISIGEKVISEVRDYLKEGLEIMPIDSSTIQPKM